MDTDGYLMNVLILLTEGISWVHIGLSLLSWKLEHEDPNAEYK